MRLLFEIQFDGSSFHGWQKQLNAPTVQQCIEEKLAILYRQSIETLGCGRTDTGVHAKQFFFHADTPFEISLDHLKYKLNKILPESICVLSINPVANNFNARFDALWREYHYYISPTKDPFHLYYSWSMGAKLDIHLMNEACKLLLMHKDFECFSKVHTEVNNFNCDVISAQWFEHENQQIVFRIQANRFLRNMVRAIVGTMIEIGRGKMTLSEFSKVLESKNRCEAGQSVPAHGLFLTKVIYPALT